MSQTIAYTHRWIIYTCVCLFSFIFSLYFVIIGSLKKCSNKKECTHSHACGFTNPLWARNAAKKNNATHKDKINLYRWIKVFLCRLWVIISTNQRVYLCVYASYIQTYVCMYVFACLLACLLCILNLVTMVWKLFVRLLTHHSHETLQRVRNRCLCWITFLYLRGRQWRWRRLRHCHCCFLHFSQSNPIVRFRSIETKG